MEDGFSARFSASERTYVYAVLNRSERSAPLARYAYHVPHPLDLDAMQAACAHLVGEHDFRSFCGILPETGPTIRRVNHLSIGRQGSLVRVEITAGGFLHHMVRTIVGTLLECASGRRLPGELPDVLAALDRRAAGSTAPGHGLYLAGVRYDGYDSFAEPPLFSGSPVPLLD